MRQTLAITFNGQIPKDFLNNVILKYARDYNLEGMAQLKKNDNKVHLSVSGVPENVENFLDVLHEEVEKHQLHPLEIEPHATKKDFRGIFRILK
jgi:acylphosphatase